MKTRLDLCVLMAGAALALTACGGGGGKFLVTNPPPPPSDTPPPPPTAAKVTIFPQPVVGEFTSVGVSTNLGEWSNAGVPSTTTSNARITALTSATTSQPIIRYTPDGVYEMRLPGEAYRQLVQDERISKSHTNEPFLQISGEPKYLTLSHSSEGFRYSAMGTWWRPDLDFGFTADVGVMAFGMPTPAGKVPVSGVASYGGLVSGISDIKMFDPATESWVLIPVGGTVDLNFDFGKGTLGGSMTLTLPDGMNPVVLGTWNFKETVFSTGSTSYSGRFDTSLSGHNFFLGRFTGPNAEETIGAWGLPFLFTKDIHGVSADGEQHQALGAWIAKRGN